MMTWHTQSMGTLTDLKDKLIRKISTSFLLNWLDGYKTVVARVWQGVNAILTGALTLALVGSWLASNLKLELGLNDAKAKERLES